MSVDLKTFIKQALAEKRNVEIGKFNLLNLDEIRESAGDAWPNLKKRIFEAGAHFIEKRVGANDAVITCNEGFLILFANPEIDIAIEVEAIFEGMKLFFLGQPELKGLKLGVETLSADARGVTALVAPPAQPVPASAPAEKPSRVPPASATTQARTNANFKAFFRPIWDAERQAFAANICYAKVAIEDRWMEYRRARHLRMTALPEEDADNAALEAAIQALRTSLQKKQKQTLLIGVHASTLENRDSLKAWSDLFTPLPEPLRRRFWVKIGDLPEAPQDALKLLDIVRALGVTVIAERPFGECELEHFEAESAELFAMTTRPPSNAESEGLLDHELKALNRFAGEARRLQAAAFLDDIREPRTFKDVMATGVRFLAGKMVLRESASPSPLRPFSVVDLARLANAA
ncbi:MAG: hypothetical protein GYB36_06675 [Alphaproteobacteria bacterium]|nr:hypothetical protein [Alphaproteobacteria bacterium]